MNIILLSGGSGKRLWPLSNGVRSKQFLKVFRRTDGTKESMAQRMYRMIHEVDPDAKITIATSETQVPQIRSQLGNEIGISIEPTRRDTFPAIALAAAYLKEQGVQPEEPVVVCPVDPYVETSYFECLKQLCSEAGKKNAANLTLMGIKPTFPSEKYGYIIPVTSEKISSVKEFKEKPDGQTAAKYIEQGGLWNGGVFAFELSYLLGIASALLGSSDYTVLYEGYSRLPKISFDYAVVEKEKSINVVRYEGSWKDMGTWNTLSETMDEDVTGHAIAVGCTNTHVMNELSLPMIVLGVKDCVVAATPDGILVSDKDASPKLKDYVGEQRPMYERRSWGEYRVLDYKAHSASDTNSLIKELILMPGQHLSYQRHEHRTEVWTFTEGEGELVLDDVIRQVSRGDVAIIPVGMKHAVRAVTELHIVEVQIGDELVEEDIEHLEWNWE